jgi:hypothetical protein
MEPSALLLRCGFLLATGISLDVCVTFGRSADMLKKLYAWWRQKNHRDLLLEAIGDARLFEEWEAAAYKLDEVLDYDMWYANPTTHEMHPPMYTDYGLIGDKRL